MSETKAKKPEPIRISTYDLDQIFPDGQPQVSHKSNTLTATLDKLEQRRTETYSKQLQEKQATLAIKGMDLEIAEAENKIKLLQAGSKPNVDVAALIQPTPTAPVLTPQIIEVLAQLSPETREKMIPSIIAILQGTAASKQDPMAQIVTLMTYNKMKENPNTSSEDMVKMIQTMSEQLRLGIELGRQNQPPLNTQMNSTEQVILMVKAISDVIKAQQPVAGGLEMLTNEALFNRLDKMGVFGRAQDKEAVTSALGLEAVKYKADVDLKIEMFKQEREDKKEMAQFQATADEQKWSMVRGIFDGPLGKMLSGMGGAVAQRIQPSQQQTQTQQQQSQLQQSQQIPFRKPATKVVPVEMDCPNCSSKIFMNSDATKVICPYCEVMLMVEQTNEAQDNKQAQPQPVQQQPEQQGTSEVP